MAGRILVIRGGAIGDFILTLPAIRLLRENFPGCHLEILGYRHIACLADGRFYANSVRSIEYGPLAGFFNPRADLDPELVEYFAGFHQIVSYIYDPDKLFECCLRRSGVKNLITVSPKVSDEAHAAHQLARPLEQMALWLDDPAAQFFPSEADIERARQIIAGLPRPLVAIHPGSGGEKKNWPVERWMEIRDKLLADARVGHVLIIGGESDQRQLALMQNSGPAKTTILESLPLPALGAIFAQCEVFAGHDSGISHLAAAAGTNCLLLFGPTDPEIWAPANSAVTVLRALEGRLSALEVATVWDKLEKMLSNVA